MLQRYDYFRNLPKKTASIFTFYKLPQIFLDIAVEGGFLRPAVGFEGLTDITLHIWRHGTGAVVVLVIAFAGIDMDEVVLDGTLHTARHVIIDSEEPDGHADGFILAEQRTIFTLHLRIVQVDTICINSVFGFVTGKNTMEAVFTKGADRTIADAIVICLLCKDLLSGFGGLVFFRHIACKVNENVGVKQIFLSKNL